MNKIIIVIVCLFIVASAFAGYRYMDDSDHQDNIQYNSFPVARKNIQRVVSASGRIEAHRNVEIKSKASGEIVSMPFEVSDPVKKGDRLVELNPIDEERNVRRSRSDLETARAAYEDARAKTKRLEDLEGQGLASREEYETQRLQMVRAAADLEKRKIDLELAEQRLVETRVPAPFDGVVSERYVQEGQIISSGMSGTTDGTPLLLLSDLSRLYAEASVDESDIGLVKVGQSAEISVDAYPNDKFSGEVRRIDVRGTSVSNVISFKTEVEVLDDEKQRLRPEMTASVDIIVEEARGTLVVPAHALQRDRGGYTVMAGPAPANLEERDVEVGIHAGDRVQILSGLAENDTVWVAGQSGGEWSRSQSFSPRRLMR